MGVRLSPTVLFRNICGVVCVCVTEDMLIYEGGACWVGERGHRHDRYARPAKGRAVARAAEGRDRVR